MKTYTVDEVRAMLRAECDKAGSGYAWAKANGLSDATVSLVLRQLREPGAKVEKSLGLKRVWVLDKEFESA